MNILNIYVLNACAINLPDAMKKFLVAIVGFFSAIAHSATVNLSQNFDAQDKFIEIVEPMQYKIISIGSFRSGDKLSFQVIAANKVYNDITACLVSGDELPAWHPGSPCRGKVKSGTPFAVQGEIPSDGKYHIILDNSYANFIKKQIIVNIKSRRFLSADDSARIKRPFVKVQAMLSSTFEDAEFDITIKPCGQSNAFSDNRTAEITFCTEIINELISKQSQGGLLAILLHEYGHSLLNRWGEPGSSEEDMADQFATVMLLKGGDDGRRLLQQWIAYWTERDSRSEALQQLTYGDTHSLSIQRARNIQGSMNFPNEITRRWNKMLYRHMQKDALVKIIDKPLKSDDIDLARDALKSK